MSMRVHLPQKIASFSSLASTQRKTTISNNRFQSIIIATQMTKSEDEITEETNNILGYTSDATDAASAVVSSGINGDDSAAAAGAILTNDATTSPTNDSKARSSSSSSGFSLILFPILLFKFTIVLLVKFASDIVVFPMLYLYRVIKLGKRKILSALLKKKNDGNWNVKVNGDSVA
jgi:hypothetical protein